MTENELIKSLEIFTHKLKNPLHAVGINTDVLKVKLGKLIPQQQDVMKHVNIIDSETRRVEKIAMRFMEYLKLSEKEKQKIDLKKFLEGA